MVLRYDFKKYTTIKQVDYTRMDLLLVLLLLIFLYYISRFAFDSQFRTCHMENIVESVHATARTCVGVAADLAQTCSHWFGPTQVLVGGTPEYLSQSLRYQLQNR